jgi:hypothetical protein
VRLTVAGAATSACASGDAVRAGETGAVEDQRAAIADEDGAAERRASAATRFSPRAAATAIGAAGARFRSSQHCGRRTCPVADVPETRGDGAGKIVA